LCNGAQDAQQESLSVKGVEREVEGRKGFEDGNEMREVEDNDLCPSELCFLSLRKVWIISAQPSAFTTSHHSALLL